MTSIDSGTPGHEPTGIRLARYVRHHDTAVWLGFTVSALLLAALAAALVVLTGTPGGEAVVLPPLLVLIVAAWLTIVRLEIMHDRRLCEACITELPLNPGAEALRYDGRLRAAHWTIDHKISYRLIVVSYIAVLAVGTSLSSLMANAATVALASTGLAVLLALNTAFAAHRKYGPWCPYCRRNNGGGGLFMPDPEPAGSTSRRR